MGLKSIMHNLRRPLKRLTRACALALFKAKDQFWRILTRVKFSKIIKILSDAKFYEESFLKYNLGLLITGTLRKIQISLLRRRLRNTYFRDNTSYKICQKIARAQEMINEASVTS